MNQSQSSHTSTQSQPRTAITDQTLAKIMKTAHEAFARDGYHGVKIVKLCEAAQIANGTFYNYFRNKSELYDAVIKEAYDKMMARLTTVGPRRESMGIVERDRADVEIILKFAEDNRDLTLASIYDRQLSGEVDEALTERIIEQRAEELEGWRKEGRLPAVHDPEFSARAEVAVTNGIVRNWLRNDCKNRDQVAQNLSKLRLRMLGIS